MDWKIRARSNQCHACDSPFGEGQIYHTLLFSEGDENRRIDVCRECWKGQYGHGTSDRKGFISHWSGRFQIPPPPLPEPIQKESAEAALRKLVKLKKPEWVPVCFILATMLERKRLLKMRKQTHPILVYEHSKTGDVFTIRDPELRLDELEQVQRDVAFLLESGVDAFLQKDNSNNSESQNSDSNSDSYNSESDSDSHDSDDLDDEDDSDENDDSHNS